MYKKIKGAVILGFTYLSIQCIQSLFFIYYCFRIGILNLFNHKIYKIYQKLIMTKLTIQNSGTEKMKACMMIMHVCVCVYIKLK